MHTHIIFSMGISISVSLSHCQPSVFVYTVFKIKFFFMLKTFYKKDFEKVL